MPSLVSSLNGISVGHGLEAGSISQRWCYHAPATRGYDLLPLAEPESHGSHQVDRHHPYDGAHAVLQLKAVTAH